MSDIKNKVVIDLAKLDEALLPNDDLRRCVVKVLLKVDIRTLPSYIQSLDLKGITASELNLIDCYRVIREAGVLFKEKRHPIYQIESIVQENNVTVMNEGISYIKEGKQVDMSSKMGMIGTDPLSSYFGATSTLLAYSTRENSKGEVSRAVVSPLSKVVQYPVYDLTKARSAIKTHVESSTVSRDMVFEALNNDQKKGLMVMDHTYQSVPLYSQPQPTIKNAILKHLGNKKPPFLITGSAPCVSSSTVIVDESRLTFQVLWGSLLISRSLRGGDQKGMGALSVGYYSFDMPPSYVRAVSRAREILSICEILVIKVVQIDGGIKEYSQLLVQILVGNGLSVVTNTGKELCTKDSPPGVYGYSNVRRLRVVSDVFEEPTYSKVGVFLNEGRFDEHAKVLDSFFKNLCMVYTSYTSALCSYAEKHEYTIFPSLSPHSGKVWLISTPIPEISKVATPSVMMQRMMLGCYSRNLYPYTRKPFFTLDVLRDVFRRSIVIPRTIVTRDKGLEDSLFTVVPHGEAPEPDLSLENYVYKEAVVFSFDKLSYMCDRVRDDMVDDLEGTIIRILRIGEDLEKRALYLIASQDGAIEKVLNKIEKAEVVERLDKIQDDIVVQPSAPNESEGFDDDFLKSLDIGSIERGDISQKK